MRLLGVGLALALLQSSAFAMDVDEGKAFLQGAWRTPSESWIFEGDTWHQFNGGKQFETAYEVEAMPAQMFRVVSVDTGRRYVVHADRELGTMNWFIEGESDRIAFLMRVKD